MAKGALALLMLAMALPAWGVSIYEETVACMRANVPTSLRTQSFTMTSTDRDSGTRRIAGKVFAETEKDLLRVMLRVQEPADLAGSAYLLLERAGDKSDDVYLSLPKVNRVRHITGTQASQSLLASDFSYADIRQLENAFAGGTGTSEPAEKIGERAVDVITVTPPVGKGSPYSRIRAWVDQKTCVALKADFYEGTKVRKRLTVPSTALLPSGKFWYPAELEMSDLKQGTRTVMKLSLVESDKDMADRYFNPNTFALAQ